MIHIYYLFYVSRRIYCAYLKVAAADIITAMDMSLHFTDVIAIKY